jgi:PTS system nitrogen regulatory IIA component
MTISLMKHQPRKPVVSAASDSDVMTLEEAAAFLRCHPRTLVRKADALHISHRRIGTLWRFSRSELEAWMRKQESEAA